MSTTDKDNGDFGRATYVGNIYRLDNPLFQFHDTRFVILMMLDETSGCALLILPIVLDVKFCLFLLLSRITF